MQKEYICFERQIKYAYNLSHLQVTSSHRSDLTNSKCLTNRLKLSIISFSNKGDTVSNQDMSFFVGEEDSRTCHSLLERKIVGHVILCWRGR